MIHRDPIWKRLQARGVREQNQSMLFALSNALQDYTEAVPSSILQWVANLERHSALSLVKFFQFEVDFFSLFLSGQKGITKSIAKSY